MERRLKDDGRVTLPDEGDLISPDIPVEAIRAYSMGRIDGDIRARLAPGLQLEQPDDGMRVRVAHVKIDGEWVPL